MRPEDSGSSRPGDVSGPGATRRPDDRPGGGAPHHDPAGGAPPDAADGASYNPASGAPGDPPSSAAHDPAGSAPHDAVGGSAPDDNWPDDEADDQAAPTWPAAPAGSYGAGAPYGQPGPRHRRPLALTAVAVAALAVGAGGAAAIIHELPQ